MFYKFNGSYATLPEKPPFFKKSYFKTPLKSYFKIYCKINWLWILLEKDKLISMDFPSKFMRRLKNVLEATEVMPLNFANLQSL